MMSYFINLPFLFLYFLSFLIFTIQLCLLCVEAFLPPKGPTGGCTDLYVKNYEKTLFCKVCVVWHTYVWMRVCVYVSACVRVYIYTYICVYLLGYCGSSSFFSFVCNVNDSVPPCKLKS